MFSKTNLHRVRKSWGSFLVGIGCLDVVLGLAVGENSQLIRGHR